MITFDPNKLSLTFCNLVCVTYGKQSSITTAPSRRSKKRDTFHVSHNVCRVFKREYTQTRYPLTVVAAILRYDDQVIDIARHYDIFMSDIKEKNAELWMARQREMLGELIMHLTPYTGMSFDGEAVMGPTTLTETLTVGSIAFSIRKGLRLSEQYRGMLKNSEYVPTLSREIACIESGACSVSIDKSGLTTLIIDGDAKELANLLDGGTVTLAYADSYVSAICSAFGFHNIDIFDILSIVETLHTVDLRRIDPIVKHNFYTSTKAIAVIDRLLELSQSATTVVEISTIRRQMNALLQRGTKVVARDREFLDQIARVLKPGKRVEDVHMIDYDSQYSFALITGSF